MELDIEMAKPAPIEGVLIGPYLPEGQEGALSRTGYYHAATDAAVRFEIDVSASAFNLERIRHAAL